MNGLIHLLIGGLAIGLALGSDSDIAVNQSGALSEIGGTPLGRVLLWSAVAGLVSLGLWQIMKAGLVVNPSLLAQWGLRITEVGKGVIYLFLGLAALAYTLGGTTSSSGVIRSITEYLLGSTFGVVVVAIIGLIGVGAGIGFISVGAAVTGDAQLATGLDGAIRLLARLPYGDIALAVVGLGLGFYGGFLIARSRLGRLWLQGRIEP